MKVASDPLHVRCEELLDAFRRVGRDDEADVNGHVTFLPAYADDGKYLVHVRVGTAARDHRNVADPAGDGFIQGFATRLAIDF